MEAYHKFKNNKYLSRKPTFLQGIALIPIGLVMTYLICVLISMALCDRVVNGYMFKLAGIYTAYAAPVVLILVSVYILRASGYVKLYEDHLTYHRYCFSKKCRKIAYSDISECVVANGLRIRRGEYSHEIGIYLYNRGKVLCRFEKNPKLVLELYEIVGDKNFRVIGDNCRLKTIDKFFDIDFSELTKEQKLILMKHYCKSTKGNEVSGEKLLKKKGLM